MGIVTGTERRFQRPLRSCGESSGEQAHGEEAGKCDKLQSGAHSTPGADELNDQLRQTFVRWYPGMQTEQGPQTRRRMLNTLNCDGMVP